MFASDRVVAERIERGVAGKELLAGERVVWRGGKVPSRLQRLVLGTVMLGRQWESEAEIDGTPARSGGGGELASDGVINALRPVHGRHHEPAVGVKHG